MKIIWELRHATHTRFLESLSPVPHLESVLTGRYLGFVGHLVTTNNWKISMINELALVKRGILELDFDDNNLEAILEQICAD